MPEPEAEETIKFHLSLNVSDLDTAVGFYRVLFGAEPAKHFADYAKFELEDPPVIFSLAPHAPGPGASLSHLGLRVSTPEALRAAQERLQAAGLCTQDQQGTVCGYARQDKVWTRDPDGNFWEIYHLEEEIDPLTVRRSVEGPAARLEPKSGPAIWEHFLTHSLAEGIPHADESLDEVLLTGTLNAPLEPEQRAFIAAEALRVLKPGGKVVTHGLMSDLPLPDPQPELPGLAALVSRVPAREEAEALLVEAGFVGVQLVKLTEAPWFVHAGIGLREVKFVGWKGLPAADGEARSILYKGPFAEVQADGEWCFRRGERVSIPLAVWQQLRLGPSAEQFLFFDPDTETACSA